MVNSLRLSLWLTCVLAACSSVRATPAIEHRGAPVVQKRSVANRPVRHLIERTVPVADPAIAGAATGVIQGLVRDANTGKPIAGAVVIATTSQVAGEHSQLTDAQGAYRLDNLPPGLFTLGFYYGRVVIQRVRNVEVRAANGTTVNVRADLRPSRFIDVRDHVHHCHGATRTLDRR